MRLMASASQATSTRAPGAGSLEGQGTLLLEVNDLNVRFGPVRAVSGVSFAVNRGEFYGIVGESGSGKSITARSIINLLPPAARSSGRVLFEGQDVLSASPAELRKLRGAGIGFIFQDAVAALDPVYTVGAQLAEVYRVNARVASPTQATQRAEALLEEVGINDPTRCLASYPHQLSGGMKQRVVIAAALIADPKLIIADEPTTALDVTVQKQVLELLQRIAAARGAAVIMITHDLGVVAEICDRTAVFYGGTVVEEADTTSLFLKTRHPYTAALIRSLPKLGVKEAFHAIPGSPPKIIDRLNECPFAPRCERAREECLSQLPPETCFQDHRFRCFHPQP